MKKGMSIIIAVVGVILFITGLAIKVPSKELTTYSSLGKKYSVIEEYVGGDAYNYIIGASLVGGEIAGAKTQKAIFISFGLLLLCNGMFLFVKEKENENEKDNNINYEQFNVDNEVITDNLVGNENN